MRINSFPEHPLVTLFVDGRRRCDFDDEPESWARSEDDGARDLTPTETAEALAPIVDLVAYGSELGRPCDGVYCCG